MPELWIDDEDAGVDPATSHPSFVAAAPAWWFDRDELAPFGCEPGHDALRELETWYADGGDDADLDEHLADETEAWGLGVPDDVYAGDPADAVAWLQEGGEPRVLQADAQRRVAAALAQWKIRGHLSPQPRRIAANALLVQRVLLERFSISHGEWEHGDEVLARLGAIMDALRGAPVRR